MPLPSPGDLLCRVEDLPDPGARGFRFRNGDELFQSFLVRRGGRVFAYVDRCPHAGFPLALDPDDFLTREGDYVLCASHGALFTLEEGLCVSGPCAGKRLRPWPIRVSGGEVRAA